MKIYEKKGIEKAFQGNENIENKYNIWLNLIERDGIECHQKHKGFKFEKLSGKRENQYSIRLNKSWRVIFEIKEDYIYIIEITNHEY